VEKRIAHLPLVCARLKARQLEQLLLVLVHVQELQPFLLRGFREPRI
jgi:hypothetical protein